MFVNITHDTAAEHRRLLVAGVLLLGVVASLIGVSIAIYNKTFQPVAMVTLHADRAGLQLPKFGDVRLHGVLVGQVREVSQDGRQAVIKVGLRPEAVHDVPANVNVKILPTTLFGQKFVSFVDPARPSPERIADGDVIPASRVETNVELSRILAHLFPILRSVDPAQLNATLNALATALGGRGEKIGATLDRLDSYLSVMTPHLPALRENLVRLADVAHTYDLAAPDFLRILRNVTVTGRTVIAKRVQLSTFLQDMTGLASTADRVLTENSANLIRAGQLSRPLLRLLDTYSPEYPCLFQGLDRYTGRLEQIFRNGRVAQSMQFGARQRRAYDQRDRPEYAAHGHGPWCLGLPYPKVPAGYAPVADGSDADEPGGAAVGGPGAAAVATPIDASIFSFNPTSGYSGTASEQHVVDAILAERTGRAAGSFGSLDTLIWGPMLRGTEVSG